MVMIYFLRLVNNIVNNKGEVMYKYVIGNNRKHLTVSETTHTLVTIWAAERGLTLVEATHKLLEIAFRVERESENKEKLDE